MDNAASLNQQIDEAITTLKDRGYGGHWFPDSYGKFSMLIFLYHNSFIIEKLKNITIGVEIL
jgi:hypothetical protein